MLIVQLPRFVNEKTPTFPLTTSWGSPETTDFIKISSPEQGWPGRACAVEARGRRGEDGGGGEDRGETSPHIHAPQGDTAATRIPREGGLRNRAGCQQTPK